MNRMLRFFGSILGLALSFASSQAAAAPSWWKARGATNPAATANDYAAANVGQVKNLASKAADELNEWYPRGGAGADINRMVAAWRAAAPTGTRNDYAAINQGQLKSLVAPFYLRLAALGYRSPSLPAASEAIYPWSNSTATPIPYAAVNIGQVKYLFSFDVAPDSDGDGMPDAWELTYGLNPNDPADGLLTADADGDGMSNKAEFLARRNPKDKSDLSGATLASYEIIIRVPGTSGSKFYGLTKADGSLTEVSLPTTP